MRFIVKELSWQHGHHLLSGDVSTLGLCQEKRLQVAQILAFREVALRDWHVVPQFLREPLNWLRTRQERVVIFSRVNEFQSILVVFNSSHIILTAIRLWLLELLLQLSLQVSNSLLIHIPEEISLLDLCLVDIISILLKLPPQILDTFLMHRIDPESQWEIHFKGFIHSFKLFLRVVGLNHSHFAICICLHRFRQNNMCNCRIILAKQLGIQIFHILRF
mmetsp:Transcript_4917/g.18494  ORF Transcript_4917/g.18494 Transcript_4917/m.18494 type:complete len:219 (+) Transcript_4917:1623-2279(+)